MGVIEDVVNKAKNAADFAGKKTGEIVEISKLKLAVADIQSKINKEYLELGIIVFDAEKNSVDCKEEITLKTAVIDELSQQLSKANEKISELRCMKKCASCNSANPEEANFCLKCGSKL